jgi:WD40 repeat protein
VVGGNRSVLTTPFVAIRSFIPGELIGAFHPARSYRASNAIFSHVDPDVLFASTRYQTVRLSLADGSIAEFQGYSGSHINLEDSMTLNEDGIVLYVGYMTSHCVVAWDVETLNLIWKTDFVGYISSISYRDGLVLVAARGDPFSFLNPDDGSLIRGLFQVPASALSFHVFTGLDEFECLGLNAFVSFAWMALPR